MADGGMRALAARVRGMILRAVVRGVSDAGAAWRELKIEALKDDVDELEHAEPYGFTSHPRPEDADGAPEAIVVSVGGDRDHQVVIVCGDRRYRLTGLASGEVAMYDDLGQVFHLKRGEVLIDRVGLNPINLGAGASKGVGRAGDAVSVTIPPGTVGVGAPLNASPIVVTGTITAGSGSVNAID